MPRNGGFIGDTDGSIPLTKGILKFEQHGGPSGFVGLIDYQNGHHGFARIIPWLDCP